MIPCLKPNTKLVSTLGFHMGHSCYFPRGFFPGCKPSWALIAFMTPLTLVVTLIGVIIITIIAYSGRVANPAFFIALK